MPIVIGNKTVSNITIGGKTVSKIEIGNKIGYLQNTDYLCFTNISSSSATFTCTKNGSPSSRNLAISTDFKNWTTKSTTATWTTTVAAGKSIYIRGNNTSGFNVNGTNYYSFSMNQNYNVSGNIMCLINYSSPTSTTTIPNYCFYGLFNSSTKLKSASNLIFGGVTTVNDFGCYNMFYGCSGLTAAPNLASIKTVGERGLQCMFENCTTMTTAPNLTNITNVSTYYGLNAMYRGCSKLNKVYAPNISWSASKTTNWLQNVASSGTVYAKSTAYNSITSGVGGLPSGWTKSLIT